MKTLRFSNGDEMPALGLGTWKSAPGEVGAAVLEAIRIGYRHIDCAAIYGNESEVGDAIGEAISSGLVHREDLWITSKLWCNRHAEGDVEPAIRESIERLGCDWLDLYLVHWPVALKPDVMGPSSGDDFVSLDEIPLAETWDGMQGVLELGLTRHVGVSNYSAKKLGAHFDADVKPEALQVELHPYLQQPELVSFARENGVAVTGYSPLGSPDRPETMRGDDDPVLLDDETIGRIAGEADATVAQVMLAWAIQRGTSVIPKSTNPKRLAENLAAASLELDDDAMRAIAALDRARRYVDGAFWAKEGSPYTVADLWDE